MTRRLALLLLFTTLIVACSCSRSRVVVGTDGGTPHTPRMGALVSPPVYPSLPASTVLQLQADIGATVGGGHLTQWVDQSSNAFTFIPGTFVTSVTATATVFQAHTGYLCAVDTCGLEDVGATAWTAGQARTVVAVLLNSDIGAGVATYLSQGLVSRASAFIAGGGINYGNGVTNVTSTQIYAGSPYVLVSELTPNGMLNAAFFANGWPIKRQQVANNVAGAPAAETSSTTIELFHNSLAATTFFWNGDIEEIVGWASILSGSDVASATGYEVGRYGLTGVAGWISDAQATLPRSMSTTILATQPLAVTRLYTTSTSLAVFTQNSLGAPTQVNLTSIAVFIDGVYDQSLIVANAISPYTPVSHTLTSARLDGNPHEVDLWNGTYFQELVISGSQSSSVSSIQDTTGNTLVYPAVTSVANMLVVDGDSISIGEGGGDANGIGNQLGCFARLRTTPGQWNGRVAFYAASGRSVYSDYTLDNTMIDAATRMVTEAQNVGPGGKKVVFIEDGTNDYGGASPALPGITAPGWPDLTTAGNALGTLLDAIHAQDAAISVIVEGPIARTNETSNNAASGTPFNLPNLRTKWAAICAARSAFCNYADASVAFQGTPAVPSGQLYDGVHPNPTGQITYNIWIEAVLCYYFPSAACQGANAIFFGTEAENDSAEPVCVERRYGKCG